MPRRRGHLGRDTPPLHHLITAFCLNSHTSVCVQTMAIRDYSSADDQTLVRAAQGGDMAAFEELVARHRDKIFARAFSMMRNEEEAIDLSQEAWVKGWQRLGQFQGESSFGTWLTRIVINLCQIGRASCRERV